MRVNATTWEGRAPSSEHIEGARRLVLAFGARPRLSAAWDDIAATFGDATVLGCSTSGEIVDTSVLDDSIALAVVDFDRTEVRGATTNLDGGSYASGVRIGRALAAESLRHVLVLSDGLAVNGTELVAGIESALAPTVTVTGGLAGDGARFEHTVVGLGRDLGSERVAAIGLYGDHIRASSASLGGWDSFGPERLVTSASGNVVYEFDHQPALDLYKRYLGEHAKDLPGSALLFPLQVRFREGDEPVVRTILGVDEEHQSMTFAGTVPEGSYARLMKANFDRLIEGAAGAAQVANHGEAAPELAILISCVGRKLVLQQRIEEEVEAVRDVLGPATALVGFYSYGEISPFTPSARCELHNQTMTITTLSEAA